MKTVSVSIETKKGEIQTGNWIIEKAIPYPDIERNRWRNSGGVFREYQQDVPSGIGNQYYCYLLATGVILNDGDKYDRTSFAGFENRPGTYEFRKNSLGEMTIELNPDNPPNYANIKVRGFDTPTKTERELIINQIIPKLQECIKVNENSLIESAFKKIASNLRGRIAGARQELDELEKEAEKAIKNLKI